MTSSATAPIDIQARREAQRARCRAALLKRACPACGVKRLWRGPTLSKGKIYCMNCGKTYMKKGT